MACSSRLRSSPLAAVYTIHPPAGQGAGVRDGNERGWARTSRGRSRPTPAAVEGRGRGVSQERGEGRWAEPLLQVSFFKFRFLIGTGLRPSVSP